MFALLCLLGVLSIATPPYLFAQIFEPVKFNYKVESLGEGEFVVLIMAKMDKDWNVYSQNIGEGGPIPTKLDFSGLNGAQLVGKVEEIGHAESGMDPVFEMPITKYKNEVTFKARLKATKPEAKGKVTIEYQTCDKTKCLPPTTEEFEIEYKINASKTPTPPAPSLQPALKPKPEKDKPSIVPTPTITPTKPLDIDPKNGRTSSTASTTNTPQNNTQNSGTTASANTSESPVSTPANRQNPTGLPNASGLFNPVHWTFEQEALGNGEFLIKAKALLDKGWDIYSQNVADGGPKPTLFTLEPNDKVAVIPSTNGKWEEISSHQKTGFDKMFEMDITKFSEEVLFQQKVKLLAPTTELAGTVEFMTCDSTKCLPPVVEDMRFVLSTEPATEHSAIKSGNGNGNGNGNTSSTTPWGIFFGGMIGGLLALLTPCVFPMIPLTVNFFTKRSKDRRTGIINAVIYAASIIGIYVLLGFSITMLFGPDALNILATDPWVNIFFFAIFMAFAFSFFGYYDITLPTWLVNTSSEQEGRGGIMGIFFMAFTLALVSFSCTGPIIGTLLVQAAVGGHTTGPLLGMTGFAVALAVPFALFAAFPGWLQSLPRSGGWLNSVKVVLGFIEVALAFKFLSNADLVKQWGFLKRETFLIIWIIVSIATALYLLGKIRFPHDSPVGKLSKTRIAFAALFAGFALYMIPGIFCQPLALISGFPPPITYSYGCGSAHKSHCPHDLACYHNYDAGIAAAKQQNKPILIDFTGWGCVNCRKMEETVWNKPEVLPLLANDYVIISLYVDEKVTLPPTEQTEYTDYKGRKRTYKTVGEKWANFETSCFATNAQPLYVLLDANENLLVKEPVGFTSIEIFKNYLQKGLQNFKSSTPEGTLPCRQAQNTAAK